MGAERAISKANPPRALSETGRGHKGVSQEHAFIEPSVVRHMRAVHSKLSDTQFEARTQLYCPHDSRHHRNDTHGNRRNLRRTLRGVASTGRHRSRY